VFALWGFAALSKNWVHVYELEKFRGKQEVVLVTSGPCRYVRNPIYLGASTLIIALALVASN